MSILSKRSLPVLISDLRAIILEIDRAEDRSDVRRLNKAIGKSGELIDAINTYPDGWREFISLLNDSNRNMRLHAALQVLKHDVAMALPVLESLKTEACGSESTHARQMLAYIEEHGAPPNALRL